MPNIANQFQKMASTTNSISARIFFVLVFLGQIVKSDGQTDAFGWHRETIDSLEQVYQEKGFLYHSVFQPAPRFLAASDFVDSTIQVVPKKLNLSVAPLLAANAGAGISDGITAYSSAGAVLRFTDYQKWDASLGYTFNYRSGPNYLTRWMDSTMRPM